MKRKSQTCYLAGDADGIALRNDDWAQIIKTPLPNLRQRVGLPISNRFVNEIGEGDPNEFFWQEELRLRPIKFPFTLFAVEGNTITKELSVEEMDEVLGWTYSTVKDAYQLSQPKTVSEQIERDLRTWALRWRVDRIALGEEMEAKVPLAWHVVMAAGSGIGISGHADALARQFLNEPEIGGVRELTVHSAFGIWCASLACPISTRYKYLINIFQAGLVPASIYSRGWALYGGVPPKMKYLNTFGGLEHL